MCSVPEAAAVDADRPEVVGGERRCSACDGGNTIPCLGIMRPGSGVIEAAQND